MQLVHQDEERVFWDSPTTRLAARHMRPHEAGKAHDPSYLEDRALQYYSWMERYREEFEEKGLDNVRVELKASPTC
jgi:hypothetical protein